MAARDALAPLRARSVDRRPTPPAEAAWASVPAGPRSYRRRLRALGPPAALAVPAGALVLALVLWRLAPAGGTGELVAGALGWLLATLALPTAVLVGLPFAGGAPRYLLAVLSSALVWLVLGAVAARRATRSPVATWRDWWREFVWLLAGVWLGVIAGLAGLAFVATR